MKETETIHFEIKGAKFKSPLKPSVESHVEHVNYEKSSKFGVSPVKTDLDYVE